MTSILRRARRPLTAGLLILGLFWIGAAAAQAPDSPPAAPTIDSLIPGDKSITVAWSGPEDDVTAYDLRYIRSDAGDKSDARWTLVDDAWTTGGSELSYTIASLDLAVYYDVQVRAVNAAVDGEWSDTAKQITSCGPPAEGIADPLFPCQWNLHNTGQFGGTPGEDINVLPAWEVTLGEGVGIAIIDDGIVVDHEDLKDNLDLQRSHHLRGADAAWDGRHGTLVAGVLAARDNNLGIRGIAPRAPIYAFGPALDGYRFDIPERTKALTRATEHASVVNISLSTPPVFSDFVDPGPLWTKAVENAVHAGNNGKGIVIVQAAGNETSLGEQSNLDAALNHYGVMAACAVTNRGVRASFSETGANLWVCGPSSSNLQFGQIPGIPSTDELDYNLGFGGTSAAAPTVSGVAALVRAANPALTWRDVKLVLAGSARRNHADHDPSSHAGWEQGGLKYGSTSQRYWFNHEYGFGVVNAGAAVALARNWQLLPPFRQQVATASGTPVAIPRRVGREQAAVTSTIRVGRFIEFIEYVVVSVEIEHGDHNNLRVTLTSPSGAESILTHPLKRSWSSSPSGDPWPGAFRFGSAAHLGENPAGEWTLTVIDHNGRHEGTLKSWSITVYGHGRLPNVPTVKDMAPVSGGALMVGWTAPTQDAGEAPIQSYDLRYRKLGADWTTVQNVWTSANAGPLQHRMSGLTDGARYEFQLRAANSAGAGDWSAAQTSAFPPLSFAGQTVADLEHTIGDTHDPLVLPQAAGGSGDISYRLITERGTNNQRIQGLPLWLSFDPATRTLSGNATILGEYGMRYEAVDAESGQTVSLRFTINVVEPAPVPDAVAPSFGDATIADQRFTINQDNQVQFPEATGAGEISYRLVTESGTSERRFRGLPLWLTFDPKTRTLSGGAAVPGAYRMRYEAVDESNHAVAALRFTIHVGSPPVESVDKFFGTSTVPTQVYTVDEWITSIVLPEAWARGRRASFEYELTVETSTGELDRRGLPVGLSFAPATRLLAGFPIAVGNYEMSYTATDTSTGESSTLHFTIHVQQE